MNISFAARYAGIDPERQIGRPLTAKEYGLLLRCTAHHLEMEVGDPEAAEKHEDD